MKNSGDNVFANQTSLEDDVKSVKWDSMVSPIVNHAIVLAQLYVNQKQVLASVHQESPVNVAINVKLVLTDFIQFLAAKNATVLLWE